MKKIFVIAIAAAMTSGAAFADGLQGQGQQQGINLDILIEAEQPAEPSDIGRADNPFTSNEFSQSEQLLDQRIQYSGEYKLKNTPNVSAPALTTTMTETCMGSTSVGGAVPGFGLSFGTTWRDAACVRRLDARQLSALGYNLGAKELMCDSDAVREALARAGTPCYNDLPNEAKRPEDRAVVAPVVEAAEETEARGYNGFDVLNPDY